MTYGLLLSRLIASSLLSLGKADASIAFLSLNRSLRQSSNEFNFVDFAYARHRSSKLGVLSLNRKGGSALAAPGVQNSKLSFQWLSLLQELKRSYELLLP
ncbi:MAG: hypothetical protein K6F20_12170 [Bacteroidaceae bacterium]|nr:hypothetical protein [Bacteroidaceae bacterium]